MSRPVRRRQCPRKINLLRPIDVSLSYIYFTILLNVLSDIINEWTSDTSNYAKVHKYPIHYSYTWGDVNYVPRPTFICNYICKEINGGRAEIFSFEDLWRIVLQKKYNWYRSSNRFLLNQIIFLDIDSIDYVYTVRLNSQVHNM